MPPESASASASAPATIAMPMAAMLAHWQGHRRLTRRIIEAFPEQELFNYSVGGMRPFSAMAIEMIGMGAGIQGIATGEWPSLDTLPQHAKEGAPTTKAELLRLWDEMTEKINATWPRIAPSRFNEIDKAFGQWEGRVLDLFLYFVENEIHHRGEGYVYLRSLGIAPHPFYDRE